MKITVAMRVIGGFAIITFLLLVISLSSYFTLNSIEDATKEVNNLAVPAISSTGRLESSFLRMGKLTFEAYLEQELSGLAEKQERFNANEEDFVQELRRLKTIVAEEPGLSRSLVNIENVFEQYRTNVTSMYDNHRIELETRDAIADKFGDIEDNADDASTLILDFADLDAVQSSSQLRSAAEIGSRLETTLLTLLTVTADYSKTTTLLRAETIGNEVELTINTISDQLAEMQQAAGGRDSSGTIDEITDLVNDVNTAYTSAGGILQMQVTKLERANDAESALAASEKNIDEGLAALTSLSGLADSKAKDAEQLVNSKITGGVTQMVLIFLVAAGLAGGIAFWTVTSITRPLHKVNDILKVVSSGDLTRKLDDSSDDEFGELAKNCNELIDSLKQLISGISTRAAQLAAASEETSTVTSQTTLSIQEQKSQIAQVATATTEMHSTSMNVSQSAEDTLNQIRHADAEAEKVKAISAENRRTIEVLAVDVEQAAEVINKLHQDSASIGGILDVIRGVADQTNLLALNAAIEAARAGEQGRGFAVVADEVRTLASRTQESTQEINNMIEVLQAGAEKAVAVMNQGKEQTTVCVDQTEKAAQALNLITDAVHRAHDVSSQIEQSAREQNVVSQEISEKLENIVGIAEETATGAQQTSDSSHEVARLAEELQNSIRQFKV
ncbi:methyl-accepting chemotaxis protein [Aestuariibacter salexigens]|uniref:methyl-accepting chemotaxis protein n=1 Tax=Aestuariibacter salexigens TaxID=226010 RepID=UPI00041ED1F5|nr:methyl-accepting chemotaxis protein [Aestuariibacter salexigens]